MQFKALKSLAAAGLMLTMLSGTAFASIGSGTVTASSLRLRGEANTSSATLAFASKGSRVTIEEDAGNGWYKVTYNDEVGYMSGEWLNVVMDSGEVIQSEEVLKGTVTASVLNVRSGAGTDFDKIGSLKQGTVVNIVENCGNGWYEVSTDAITGYVSAQYIALTTADSSVTSTVGASAAALAAQLVGSRYAYGSAGPNAFDCSGLVYYIYKQLGYSIARGASSQYYNSGSFGSTAPAAGFPRPMSASSWATASSSMPPPPPIACSMTAFTAITIPTS